MTILNVVRIDPSEYENCEPLFDGLKRLDHVIGELNAEGVTSPAHYNVHHQIVQRAASQWAEPGPADLGSHAEHEEDNITYHLIRTHCVSTGPVHGDDDKTGWPMGPEPDYPHVYQRLEAALDDIWTKHEDTVVRPMRIWLPGHRSVVGDAKRVSCGYLGNTQNKASWVWQALANTECQLSVYLL